MTVRELDGEIKMMNEKQNVVIPQTEETKFLNFDDQQEEVSNVMDVDKLRMQAKDIAPQEKPKADLDFLLKIDQEEQNQSDFEQNYRFVPSTEETILDSNVETTEETKTFDNFIVNPPVDQINQKEEEIETLDVIEEDEFFSLAESINRNLKTENKTTVTKPVVTKELNRNVVFDLRGAINTIRDAINIIEQNGLKIDSDEIDLINQYQIIIKIDKEK